ncbi:MAG: radical SAM family heme chaperone HemW [Clostridiales bacterium]|nr:radical SAM family heme chaperone HemW [Clostridiales bacterium]
MAANGAKPWAIPAGIYAHIPFCVSKCAYCDFLSFGKDTAADAQERYAAALCRELKTARESFLRGVAIDTVYIGGGTPTALPAPFLLEITGEIHQFNLTEGAEFTVECNPGTVDGAYLRRLKDSGANRLSVGLQAAQNSFLKILRRAHTAEDFFNVYEAARSAGFGNINVDIMFALPGAGFDGGASAGAYQTKADWLETLNAVVKRSPEHISAYSLTLEEGTPLYGRVERGELTLPGDEADREMYALCKEVLSAAGYAHYEISNYARRGYESRHNTRYWKRTPYFGFGLGAHSFDGKARWRNTHDLSKYIGNNLSHEESRTGKGVNEEVAKEEFTPEKFKREDYETLSEKDAMAETLFLGLRLMEGVSRRGFERVFNVPLEDVYGAEIRKLVSQGLLCESGGNIRLTELGMDLANQVFVRFL